MGTIDVQGPLAAPSGTSAKDILANAGTADELAASLPDLHVEPLWQVSPYSPPASPAKLTLARWSESGSR